jgi:two-component system cell cycle sensor histidine kinase/response regulator CckA
MSEILRVLQVEDSESDAALIIRLLEKSGYSVQSERVEDAEPMRQALARQDWDVILADHQLPQFDAAAALDILRESGQDIPFIIVSGTIGQDRAAEMMRAGAHDYVLKDRIARLAPVIERETRDAQSRRERRQADEMVRDRDEWLALAVNVTQLGMFDFYPQSGKFALSDGGKRHFGLAPDAEVSYETFLSGLRHDDREGVTDVLRKAFAGEGGGEYTADFRTIGLTDQVERYLSARGRVFFDSEGNPIRFVGVTIDITERKLLEEQLRQSQKLEGIGRLAGGVAHDFNNLLTVISGYTQMTLDELPLFHPLRAGVEEVVKAAALAANLTRQLLAFSRREPSRTEIIVLNRLVASIHKMLGRMIGADVNLALRLDPAAGAIRADAGHIEQVIMNLVVNARDAMPNGGDLVIETARQIVDERFAASHLGLAPGQYASLTVSDTGTGLSADVKAHLFDPFFTTKQPGKGTGLGLSTVYGIVKQGGGSISVDTELGRGTRFTILLPSVEAQGGEAAALPVAPMPAATETILLAEDEAAVRGFVRLTLERHGYRVLVCSNGREAIECARQHAGSIDLLITDAIMPEMGGAELAERFADCRPGVPVLCMCGDGGTVWPGVASEASCLRKPFTPAALLLHVRALLDCIPESDERRAVPLT